MIKTDKMTLNKRITIRVSDIDVQQINALKDLKKGNKEVFNLSELVRIEIKKHIATFTIL
jgi:hypothetical protein